MQRRFYRLPKILCFYGPQDFVAASPTRARAFIINDLVALVELVV
jgi:hypothetical protein